MINFGECRDYFPRCVAVIEKIFKYGMLIVWIFVSFGGVIIYEKRFIESYIDPTFVLVRLAVCMLSERIFSEHRNDDL